MYVQSYKCWYIPPLYIYFSLCVNYPSMRITTPSPNGQFGPLATYVSSAKFPNFFMGLRLLT